ncbi:uracil-DNA glycosylase [Komagataeibacter rhaeticus]|nr:uracil-DNA glycosylase [Komagataeibacter rhaeticus]WPP21352.1 uracil-DNA glycosylase [Komagataeibacter rhaeticus]SAY49636.1 Uracil DNA glycosylase superfamily protein [Komagataeibacter rhaeticus]
MTDSLSLLRLYVEWGADEALDSHPHDWMAQAATIHNRAPVPQSPPIQSDRGNGHRNNHPPPPAPPPARPATPRPAAPVVEQAVAAAQAAAQAAGTLAELHAAMRDFSACPLRETATHSVGVEGPQGAPLMLIGEAPDADEDRSGHPFAGESGALVGAMFASIGIAWDSLLRAPVIPWRPPGGRPPYEAETRICLPFIQRAIILARPAHVIVMGNLPVSLLLEGGATAARMRGRWRSLTLPAHGLPPTASAPSVPVLAMRHPQQLRASATARRDTWRDMLSIRETLGNMAAKS